MGGGMHFLNKKSWHVSNLSNVEEVWKAEQKKAAEAKKLKELQRELDEERREEMLQKEAEDAGIVRKPKQVRLNWMYQGKGVAGNSEESSKGADEAAQEAKRRRDEYLLGKEFDPTKKEVSHVKQLEENTRSTPGSLWLNKASTKTELFHKMHDDPLIKIQAAESRLSGVSNEQYKAAVSRKRSSTSIDAKTVKRARKRLKKLAKKEKKAKKKLRKKLKKRSKKKKKVSSSDEDSDENGKSSLEDNTHKSPKSLEKKQPSDDGGHKQKELASSKDSTIDTAPGTVNSVANSTDDKIETTITSITTKNNESSVSQKVQPKVNLHKIPEETFIMTTEKAKKILSGEIAPPDNWTPAEVLKANMAAKILEGKLKAPAGWTPSLVLRAAQGKSVPEFSSDPSRSNERPTTNQYYRGNNAYSEYEKNRWRRKQRRRSYSRGRGRDRIRSRSRSRRRSRRHNRSRSYSHDSRSRSRGRSRRHKRSRSRGRSRRHKRSRSYSSDSRSRSRKRKGSRRHKRSRSYSRGSRSRSRSRSHSLSLKEKVLRQKLEASKSSKEEQTKAEKLSQMIADAQKHQMGRKQRIDDANQRSIEALGKETDEATKKSSVPLFLESAKRKIYSTNKLNETEKLDKSKLLRQRSHYNQRSLTSESFMQR